MYSFLFVLPFFLQIIGFSVVFIINYKYIINYINK